MSKGEYHLKRAALEVTEGNPLKQPKQPTETVGNTSNPEQPMEESSVTNTSNPEQPMEGSSVTTMLCDDHETPPGEASSIETLCFKEMLQNSNLDNSLGKYFSNISGIVPGHFIVTEHYKKLIHYGNTDWLFTNEYGVPVQITGPKGVGKSTSLYALALRLTISPKQEDTTILYFTERSPLQSLEMIMKEYLQFNNLNCKFSDLAQTIISLETRKFVLCVDIGKHNNPEEGRKLLEATGPLFHNLNQHIKLIIAHSSGEGFDRKHQDLFETLRHCNSECVELENFNDKEADKFVQTYKLTKLPLLKQMTNWNPHLLRLVSSVHKRYGKDEYEEAHVRASISQEVESLTASTFVVLDEFSKLQEFSERLRDTDFFLYYARTGFEMNTNCLCSFFKSWVYQEGHCYIPHVNRKNDTCVIAMNFPNADKVISNKITKLVSDQHEPITGGLLGYQFESQFFLACQKTNKFTIVFDKQSVTLVKEFCSSVDIKKDEMLTTGCLYKLYSSHPAIDFVGEFKGGDQAYLVFFQLSISTYLAHHSKVWHILCKYDKFEEFKENTVLDYYKSLSVATQVIYVFVSPRERSIPSSMEKHAKDHKIQIKLGRLHLESPDHIANAIAAFTNKE